MKKISEPQPFLGHLYLAGHVRHADLLQELTVPGSSMTRHDGSDWKAVGSVGKMTCQTGVGGLECCSVTSPWYGLTIHLKRENHVSSRINGFVKGEGATILIPHLTRDQCYHRERLDSQTHTLYTSS